MLEAVGWAVVVLIVWTALALLVALPVARRLRRNQPPPTEPDDP